MAGLRSPGPREGSVCKGELASAAPSPVAETGAQGPLSWGRTLENPATLGSYLRGLQGARNQHLGLLKLRQDAAGPWGRNAAGKGSEKGLEEGRGSANPTHNPGLDRRCLPWLCPEGSAMDPLKGFQGRGEGPPTGLEGWNRAAPFLPPEGNWAQNAPGLLFSGPPPQVHTPHRILVFLSRESVMHRFGGVNGT